MSQQWVQGPNGWVPQNQPKPKSNTVTVLLAIGLVIGMVLAIAGLYLYVTKPAVEVPGPTVTHTVEKTVPGPTKTVTAEPTEGPEEPKQPTEEPTNSEFSYQEMKDVLEAYGVIINDSVNTNCVNTGYGNDYVLAVVNPDCADKATVDKALDAVIKDSDADQFPYYTRGGNWLVLATDKSAADGAKRLFGGKVEKL